jgi:hypothetical protein
VLILALACHDAPETPTVPGCGVIGQVRAVRSDGDAQERTFSVDLSEDELVWVLCESDDGDQLLAESPDAACGGPVEQRTVTVSSPPWPPFVVEPPGGASQPYTLLNTQAGSPSDETGSWLLVADRDGGVRWTYRVGSDLIVDLDAQPIAGGVHVGGGWAWFREDQSNRGVFRDLDWSGRTLLDRPLPAFGLGFNHHSQQQPDGTYLSLTGTDDAFGGDTFHGVGIEQWDPVDGLVWTWDSQKLLDEGVLAPPADPRLDAPYHANSVKIVDDALGEAVWVSLYGAREIWRLDRASGERTHVFGPNGTFSLQDVDGNSLGPEHWSYVQHDPDYADGGRVLMYDNGQDRPVDVPYSRVVEFRLDLVADTATELWDWTEPGWYDPVLGDADYLPNGHVLVARGYNLRWTPEGDDVSQVLELSPPDDVVWRLKFTDPQWQLFRAERFDGCPIFPNPRYCPEVAARLAELQR